MICRVKFSVSKPPLSTIHLSVHVKSNQNFRLTLSAHETDVTESLSSDKSQSFVTCEEVNKLRCKYSLRYREG